MKTFICKKSTQKTILGGAIGAIAVILLISSCKNFLSSGNIKDNIKNKIDYNEAKSVQINLSCEKEIGTFYPEGYYSAKLGFAFELQFIPDTENYAIKDTSTMLQAVSRISGEGRAEYVEFTPLAQSLEDKNLGLYRINVKVIKEADDLQIRPLVTERPKVIDVFPAYNPSGVNQDTTIRVTFNKAVDPASFGDYSCVRIFDSENQNITDYYETPFFSNDNTVLQIRKAAGSLIIPEQSEKTFEDISLEIDFSNIVDTETIRLSQIEPYTFRVNKKYDNVKPVITSVILKTSSDPSSSNYHTLTDKPFEQWNNAATQEYPFGHFSQNHVGSEIYIEASGYDKDSSISGIQIVETYYKTVNAKDTALTSKTVVFGVNKFVYSSTDTNNNNIYSLNDSYKFVSITDGVFKLDISVIDNAGNISVPITYYVVKDTLIESTAIKFEETKAYDNYHPTSPWDDEYEYKDIFEHVRIVQNNDDTVVLTLTDSSVDTFYEGCSTQYNVEMYYGYSQDSINTRVTKENNSFTFVRNPELITFIIFKFSDDVGNQTEFLRVLPPVPQIDSYIAASDSDIEIGGEEHYVKIYPKNLAMYSSMCNSYGADSFGLFYIIKNNTTVNANYATEIAGRSQIKDYDYDNYDYKDYMFYIVIYFRYGETYWYSVLSNDYLTFKAYSTGDSVYIKTKEVNGEDVMDITLTTITGSPDNTLRTYIKNYLQATIEPCAGTGCYKIILDDYKTHGIDTSSIIYTFECVNDDNNDIKYFFTEPTFYLPSMAKYKVYVYAHEKNSNNYYKSSWRYCYVNGADNFNNVYSFLLAEDLSSPSFDDQEHSFVNDTADYWIEPSLPIDNPQTASYGVKVGMREDPADPEYGFIDYYFIPNSNTSANAYSLYTLQDLQAYEKHTLRYKFTDTCLKIPYGDLEEGLYTICLVAEDKNGNYTIKCAPAFNKTLDYQVPIEFIYTGDDDGYYKISSTIPDLDNDFFISDEELANSRARDFNIDFYNSENNQWNRLYSVDPKGGGAQGSYALEWYFTFQGKDNTEPYDGWMKISGPKFELGRSTVYEPYNSIAEYGFHLAEYIYTPYEKARTTPDIVEQPCERKSVIPLANNYKVLCDNSVFVHTMYCSKKLTETTTEYDLALWETKGFETGIIVHEGSCEIIIITDENNIMIEERNYDQEYYSTHNSFYYTYDNYDDIPEGYYYTTIFHFADGSAQMTEIKQK